MRVSNVTVGVRGQDYKARVSVGVRVTFQPQRLVRRHDVDGEEVGGDVEEGRPAPEERQPPALSGKPVLGGRG